MIVGVLVACEGFKKAMDSHSDSVAKAGPEELTVDRLAALLSQAKVPVTADLAKAITNVWVDYELLGVAAAHGDSLSDPKTVDDALWPIVAQMRAGKWHDVVVKGFNVDTSGTEAKSNCGSAIGRSFTRPCREIRKSYSRIACTCSSWLCTRIQCAQPRNCLCSQ